MGVNILIDTNAAIDYLAGKLPEKGVQKIDQLLTNKNAQISIIVKIELLSFNPPNPDDLEIIEAFIHKCAILSLTDTIANRTYLLRREYKIKLPDAIIAATALEHNLPLLTRNVSDFKQIPKLTVLNPHAL